MLGWKISSKRVCLRAKLICFNVLHQSRQDVPIALRNKLGYCFGQEAPHKH